MTCANKLFRILAIECNKTIQKKVKVEILVIDF